MATGGGGYEFVEELPEELTCSICANVLCQPHLMNCCEQQFCEACLEQWLKKSPVCPHCRSTDYSHMLMRQKCRKLGELRIYCPNKQHGCQSILKISECTIHISAGCSYVQQSCPLCSLEVFQGDLEEHMEKQCPRRQVSCTYCELREEHQFIIGEHLKLCPLYPLECPKQCGATVLRKNIDTHKSTCPAELLACPFSELGCEVQVMRRDLERHVETNTLQHMMKLAKSHLELKAQHEKFQEEHAALKENYTAIQRDYTSQKQLNASISKLMRGLPIMFSDNLQIFQMQTLLSDTTSVSMEKPLILTLSETNLKAGYHYINVQKAKFKLEWEWFELEPRERTIHSADMYHKLAQGMHHVATPKYHFKTFVGDPQKILPCDIEISVSRLGERKNYSKLGVVCCSASISPDNSLQCSGITRYPCKLANNLQIGIKFLPHNKHACKCDCHHFEKKGRR